jgi:integral membrane protein
VTETRRLLDRVRIVAVLDALLLVPLVWASLTDRDGLVSVLGPIHGVGFVLLVLMTVHGANQQRWGWWFPAITLVTGGPLGSLVGDLRVRRSLR